jgi:hypothetical protein
VQHDSKTSQLLLLLFPISFPTAKVQLLPFSRVSHQELVNMQWSQFSLRFLKIVKNQKGVINLTLIDSSILEILILNESTTCSMLMAIKREVMIFG